MSKNASTHMTGELHLHKLLQQLLGSITGGMSN